MQQELCVFKLKCMLYVIIYFLQVKDYQLLR